MCEEKGIIAVEHHPKLSHSSALNF